MSIFLITGMFYDFNLLNLQLRNNKQIRQNLEPGLLISLSDSCRIVDRQCENPDPDPSAVEFNLAIAYILTGPFKVIRKFFFKP